MTTQTQTCQPPPRLGPRPLGLHMAIEGWIQQISCAGLMPSKNGWPPWNQTLPNPLQVLAAEKQKQKPDLLQGTWTEHIEPAPFIDAVHRGARDRLESFVAGIKAYQTHAHFRSFQAPPSIWSNGSASLIAYGDAEGRVPVLFIPSLINRAYILDLAEDRSLVRTAAGADLRVYLLDWGEPNAAEKNFAIEDYVDGVVIPALEEIKRRTGHKPIVVGYCMGGTLALAPTILRPDLVSGLALLAAPWDFHIESESSRFFLQLARQPLEIMLDAEGCASVDLLQALFASLDPTLAGRKFRRFARLRQGSTQAQQFVELEDWLNDGVPLAAPVAREVLFGWYGANDPILGRWRVGDVAINPSRIACPTVAFIPGQDRIVPPASARSLADAIPQATVHDVDIGHIGMIAGGSAPRRVYEPLIRWLKAV